MFLIGIEFWSRRMVVVLILLSTLSWSYEKGNGEKKGVEWMILVTLVAYVCVIWCSCRTTQNWWSAKRRERICTCPCWILLVVYREWIRLFVMHAPMCVSLSYSWQTPSFYHRSSLKWLSLSTSNLATLCHTFFGLASVLGPIFLCHDWRYTLPPQTNRKSGCGLSSVVAQTGWIWIGLDRQTAVYTV